MPEDLFSGHEENAGSPTASLSCPETAGLLRPAAGTAGRERNSQRRGPFSCSSSHPESARSPAVPLSSFPAETEAMSESIQFPPTYGQQAAEQIHFVFQE
ncbi:hypothetical protein CXT97_09935 [Akkermansia muciniphila]|nr:hypothetical protein CXT97_09935 [Akkermansia muciniphila]PND01477.1 hypothetical protein CXT90_03250 [Akkermansia muciniphila]